MLMVFATSLVVFLFLCYCRYFDETYVYSNASCLSLLCLYLGNSQVSIGPTLVFISFHFLCMLCNDFVSIYMMTI